VATCYRHPGRETGVSCSNCGRPICPDCMTSTSVGMRCPECARQKTRVVRNPSGYTDPIVTYGLIVVNVLAYIATISTGAGAAGGGIGGSDSVLAKAGLNGPAVADGEVYRLITSGFLHFSFFHLLFNMYALYILGQELEPVLGRARFGLVYFVSLLCGSFGALVAAPDAITAGASGAVFGLFGAAFVVMRSRGINPMESGLGLWLVLNLVLTFTVSHISIGGHIGGLIGGVLAGLVLMEMRDRVRVPPVVPLVVVGLLGVVAAAGAIAVA
jgi:membrane associated rhomboid family serine protease